MKTKITLKNIGCRTNQEEIITLKSALFDRGFVITENIENADVIIINTCSVTSHTESKTRRLISSFSKDAPQAKILVTGCFAQQHGAELLKLKNVAWVVGNYDKDDIPEILSNNIENNNCVFLSDDASSKKTFEVVNIQKPEVSGRTRFALKIQEGCDYKCAYCIVPSLRGRSRGARREQLTDTFKRAVDAGYKEIVLTGTHIGQYKTETDNLESLLENFLKTDGDYRIRLSSLDPRDLTQNIIDLAGAENRVCEHLHVSVQSLCGDVLTRMGRDCGDIEKLFNTLCGIRKKYPNMGLGGDFIAGHPGETDAMFSETLRNVETIGFTYGHVFRYSKRRGTPAATMPDQVSEAVKKKRAEALRELCENNHKKFLLRQTLRPLYIIVEKENPASGISGNYLKVSLSGVTCKKNSWLFTQPAKNRSVL